MFCLRIPETEALFSTSMASPHTFAVLFCVHTLHTIGPLVHTLHAIVHASFYLNIQPRGCVLLLACSIWSFSSPAHSSTCIIHPFSCHPLLHNCPAPSLFICVSPSLLYCVPFTGVLRLTVRRAVSFSNLHFPPSTPTTCHPLMPSHTTPYSHIF